jgi:hypothetical protein
MDYDKINKILERKRCFSHTHLKDYWEDILKIKDGGCDKELKDIFEWKLSGYPHPQHIDAFLEVCFEVIDEIGKENLWKYLNRGE